MWEFRQHLLIRTGNFRRVQEGGEEEGRGRGRGKLSQTKLESLALAY